MKNSTKVKAGLLLTSLACAAGATAALVMLQKKREEEVYHEAELKAMDELEEMMRAESDCASCCMRRRSARILRYIRTHLTMHPRLLNRRLRSLRLRPRKSRKPKRTKPNVTSKRTEYSVRFVYLNS